MERFGVPKNIVGFVLPTGYSFNLDGITLYLSLASVFVAQLAGVHDDARPAADDDADADADEQGRGRRAARARSSSSRRRSTQFGLPLEGAAILLGIDQIMDMGRTAVNVMGNCIATVGRRALGRRVRRRRRCGRSRRRAARPPDADRGRRRARAARRRDRPRMPRRATTSSRFDRADARHHRRRGGGRGDGARRARTSSSTAPAYNDVDGAEDHPVDALDVNAFAVRALARAARAHRRDARALQHRLRLRRHGVGAVHRRRIAPNPRSVYAASKLLGEWFALDAPRAYVLRVESLFGRARRADRAEGQRRRASCKALLAGAIAAQSSRIARSRRPTSIDAARATRQLLERPRRPGLYHCVNSGLVHVARVRAGAGAAARRRAAPHARCAWRTCRFARPRPLYCALSNAKLRDAGIDMPTWQDALARYVAATGAPSSTRD